MFKSQRVQLFRIIESADFYFFSLFIYLFLCLFLHAVMEKQARFPLPSISYLLFTKEHSRTYLGVN